MWLSLILGFYFSDCCHVSKWSFCICILCTPKWWCRYIKYLFIWLVSIFWGLNREKYLYPFQDAYSYFDVNSEIIQRGNVLPSQRRLSFSASIVCMRWWRKCFIKFHKYIILLLDNREWKGIWLSGMLSAVEKIANW